MSTLLRPPPLLLLFAGACAAQPARVPPSWSPPAGEEPASIGVADDPGSAESDDFGIGAGSPDATSATPSTLPLGSEAAEPGPPPAVRPSPTSMPPPDAAPPSSTTAAAPAPSAASALPARRAVFCLDNQSSPDALRDVLLRGVVRTAPEGVTAAMTSDLPGRFGRVAVVGTGSPWLVLVGAHLLGRNPVMAESAHHRVRPGYSIIGEPDAVRAVAGQSDAALEALVSCSQRHVGFRSEGRQSLALGGQSHDVTGAEAAVLPGSSADDLRIEGWADLATRESAEAVEAYARSEIQRYAGHFLVGPYVRHATVRREGRRVWVESPLTVTQAVLLVSFLQGMLQGGTSL